VVGTTLSVLAVLVALADLSVARAAPAPFAGEPTASWPQFRCNPSHSGANPNEPTIGSANAATLSLYWRSEIGDFVWSSPAVVDGVVFVGSFDGSVYALDASTGAKLWQRGTGDSIWSSPAVVDGVVFVGSDDGHLYALNAATGAELWSHATGAPIDSSPAVENGVVYVGASNGTVCALAASTGAQLWSHDTGGDYSFSSPAVANGVVYVGADLLDDQPAPHPGSLYALDAATGAQLWKFSVSQEVESSPAVADGVVFVGSFDGSVYAVNASTGAAVWSYQTGGGVWSSPAVTGGVVYVGSQDGSVYALDASTGARLWSEPTGGPVDSSPAVANGVVYAGSTNPLDGDLYALDAATGAKLWSYKTGDSRGVESSPAVANGVVYVGTMGSFFDRGPFRVLAFRPRPALTISSSASIVGYRRSVALTVHLGLTGVTNDLVSIYRAPYGGPRTFVTSGALDQEGTVKVRVSGRPVTTAFTATWAGDATYESLTSNPVYVRVRARVTGALSGYYGISKGYRLYHYTSAPKDCPTFTATVVPNHAGGELEFRLQRRTSVGWRTVAVDGGYRLNSKSRARVIWIPRDSSVKGMRMRTRAEWPGDPRNAPGSSDWAYCKVTS
jgi:outer membrane protein assembly factor BamB